MGWHCRTPHQSLGGSEIVPNVRLVLRAHVDAGIECQRGAVGGEHVVKRHTTGRPIHGHAKIKRTTIRLAGCIHGLPGATPTVCPVAAPNLPSMPYSVTNAPKYSRGLLATATLDGSCGVNDGKGLVRPVRVRSICTRSAPTSTPCMDDQRLAKPKAAAPEVGVAPTLTPPLIFW